MKADTYLCPDHWNNEDFLRLSESGITTELERKLWDRLAIMCGMKQTGGICDAYTYSTRQDLIDELEEVYDENERLRNEISDLEYQLSEQ